MSLHIAAAYLRRQPFQFLTGRNRISAAKLLPLHNPYTRQACTSRHATNLTWIRSLNCKGIENRRDRLEHAGHLPPMDQSHSANILLVDDDVELTVMLSDYLRAERFAVDVVYDGEDAVSAALSGRYDAVILDIMLPRLSGIEVLRQVRQRNDTPVIMLTAKGDRLDRVIGLELGADDYVPKPCFPRELVARLRAVLRRQTSRRAAPRRELTLGSLRIDLEGRRVRCGDHQPDLTPSEFDLLVALLDAEGRVASKDDLSLQVLGRPRTAYDRSIDVHVSNLRQKLSGCADHLVIVTVRGVGYRLTVRR